MNNKIKIMQFIHGMSMGGAETLVKDYCLGINKNKFDIVLLCFNNCNSPYDKMLKDAGIKIIYAEDYDDIFKKEKCNFFEKVMRKIKLYSVTKKIINKENPDIIHSHILLNLYVLFSLKNKNIKLFHTVHSDVNRYWGKGCSIKNKVDLLAGRILAHKFGQKNIALHNCMANEINDIFKVNNTVVLNNGIDYERFEKANSKDFVRSREGISQEAFVIGHVGRFSEEKNHKFLVQVFSEIYKKIPNAYLLLVGAGELKIQIEQQISKLGLTDRVKILSNRSDVPDLLNAMDLFIFPSKFEGLPVTLVEAQKMGLKCIVSDTVPEYATISNLVKRMSLKESPNLWAEEALNFKVDDIEYYNLEDWDMKNVIKKLENLYLS